jgi:two-component system cell cycle sensor histidine kinase/response regulator CckA
MRFRGTLRSGTVAVLRPLWPGDAVLVIESQPSVLKFMAHLLRMQGLTVLETRSLDEAVEAINLHQGTLELLLADVGFKNGSGADAAPRLTTLLPDAQIAYCSRRSRQDLIEEGLLDPLDPFLPKPFDLASFRALVSGRTPRSASWTARR